MNKRLNGKGIVVIGGSSGMGEAQVRRFTKEGARVLIADRNVIRGEALARELEESVSFIQHDVRDEKNWEQVIRVAETFFAGPMDGLVNNAGILVEASLEETTLETYRELIDIMQVGAFLAMKFAATSMRSKKNGSIITVSSTAGIVGYPNCFAYTAAKFAVRGMTKAAALDLADANIRVNSVHPGDTQTPMIEGRGYNANAVPLKRFAQVDEIAALVLFLLSDESSYITGAEMVIDGGYTAH